MTRCGRSDPFAEQDTLHKAARSLPRYKSPEYGQITMVAINTERQLIEGSFEHALNDLIDALDLSAFDALYRNDLTGASAYHPAVLLKVVLLAYSKGIVCSRRIAELCETNVVFIALAGGMAPHFSTIESATRALPSGIGSCTAGAWASSSRCAAT